ncbi:hypothetical protein U1Q18_010781, partial [Sarracenia purpurea var. burkii]
RLLVAAGGLGLLPVMLPVGGLVLHPAGRFEYCLGSFLLVFWKFCCHGKSVDGKFVAPIG